MVLSYVSPNYGQFRVEYWFKIKTLTLLYASQIFCFLMTIYILVYNESFPIVYENSALGNYEHMYNGMFNIKIFYPANYFPRIIFSSNNGFAFWILMSVSFIIILISVLGISGILYNRPVLLMPYIIYRWLWLILIILMVCPFIIGLQLFVNILTTLSYVPTVFGYLMIFISLISYVGGFLAVTLQICLILAEIYFVYVVSTCYENMKRNQIIVPTISVAEDGRKIILLQKPITTYQTL
ncbi:hypothetical protein PGB90_006752 [Kerria lacca]